MNEHLGLVFNLLLPALENKCIDYWVFAGVGIAGCRGRFIRKNKDVDIFVRKYDYQKTTSVLKAECIKRGDLRWVDCTPITKGAYIRPKLEIYPFNGKEIFSVVPVFIGNTNATLVFEEPSNFSTTLLVKIPRRISLYKFFTPPEENIKSIFLYCLTKRPGWKRREDKRKDGRAILTPDEFNKYFSDDI